MELICNAHARAKKGGKTTDIRKINLSVFFQSEITEKISGNGCLLRDYLEIVTECLKLSCLDRIEQSFTKFVYIAK